MNQAQPYMEMHGGAPHISSGPSYSHPAPSHYQQYPAPQAMPPASATYGTGSTYGGYGYPTGAVTSPQGPAPHMQSNLQLPGVYSKHMDSVLYEIATNLYN